MHVRTAEDYMHLFFAYNIYYASSDEKKVEECTTQVLQL